MVAGCLAPLHALRSAAVFRAWIARHGNRPEAAGRRYWMRHWLAHRPPCAARNLVAAAAAVRRSSDSDATAEFF
ncbi:hypothetical protein F511_46507 [Dorcoceras hygrometricum]|uniref:Uncharacterized protein n=1 Tax=Dorcoceras hygrometricum TaxID=472368 RepID=A0A2Z7A0A5_9LAMI|nr:hypothetical protein F511_46507 [Dorcoceras hygrometricum]